MRRQSMTALLWAAALLLGCEHPARQKAPRTVPARSEIVGVYEQMDGGVTSTVSINADGSYRQVLDRFGRQTEATGEWEIYLDEGAPRIYFSEILLPSGT